MRISLPLLSTLLLPLLCAASPTPIFSRALAARAVVTPRPSPTAPPTRRQPEFSLSLSIPPVSIPSLSLDLPKETCTPGFISYETPGLNGHVSAAACNAKWAYSPNFAAAIAFSFLFGVLTLAHVGQAVVYRNGFCWVIIMAGLWETGAYVFRALGSKDQQSDGKSIVASILVLVGPVWVNAFAYMVFGRIVYFYAPTRKVWFFSASLLALIFVCLDIVCFFVQIIGGSMAGPGTDPKTQRRGLNLYMAGIGLQEGFVVLFSILVIIFHREQLQAERIGRLSADKLKGWRMLVWTLYVCLLAITVRIVYRLAEFSGGVGHENPLPSNEPLLYVLESVPMWIALFVWNIVHPGRFIHGPDAKMPPSWVSRHMCCCCHKRRCDECSGKLGHVGPHHQRLADGSDFEDNQQMLPVHSKLPARQASVVPAASNPFEEVVSRDEAERHRLRTSPDAAYHRDVSPESTSYTAYRPHDFRN